MRKYVFFDTETAGGFLDPIPLQVSFLTNSESFTYKLSRDDMVRICSGDLYWTSPPSHFSGIALPARILAYKMADTIRQLTDAGSIFVAHNARHDVRALRSVLRSIYPANQITRIFENMPVVDTMKVAKEIHSHNRMATVETVNGKQSASLANIANRYGLTQPEPHDALADCHLLAELASRMKRYKRAGWRPLPASSYL